MIFLFHYWDRCRYSLSIISLFSVGKFPKFFYGKVICASFHFPNTCVKSLIWNVLFTSGDQGSDKVCYVIPNFFIKKFFFPNFVCICWFRLNHSSWYRLNLSYRSWITATCNLQDKGILNFEVKCVNSRSLLSICRVLLVDFWSYITGTLSHFRSMFDKFEVL